MPDEKQQLKPGLPKPARDHLNFYSDEFKSNMTSIAEGLASHAKADLVSKAHLDEAFSALKASGLQLRPWYKRSEMWTTFGGVIMGFSPTSFDMMPSLATFANVAWIGSLGTPLFVIVFSVGAVIVACGVSHSKVPIKK